MTISICNMIRVVAGLLLLFTATVSLAHNKVVVVPLLGDGSSHEHPNMEYLNLSAAAFQLSRSGTFGYQHNNGLLTTDAGPSSYYRFIANVDVPNGVTFRSLTAIYRDGDSAADVRVRLKVPRYSNEDVLSLTDVTSTGLSFGVFTRRSNTSIPLINGFHPVDNANNGYFVEVNLRNGAALRGVIIGYTTRID